MLYHQVLAPALLHSFLLPNIFDLMNNAPFGQPPAAIMDDERLCECFSGPSDDCPEVLTLLDYFEDLPDFLRVGEQFYVLPATFEGCSFSVSLSTHITVSFSS